MADLITRERAQVNIRGTTTFTNEENRCLDHAIKAVSLAIANYCKRNFDVRNYDELHNGKQSDTLVLKQTPVISVERVSFAPTAVLNITNTSSAIQQARVKTTKDGVVLTRVASGTTTVNTLLFSSYATITALDTAIDAVANGWSASIPNSTYTNWPSTDIRPIQGNLNAKDKTAEVRAYVEELSEYDVDTDKGFLLKGFTSGQQDGGRGWWYGGQQYWRVEYTAGYEEVPSDIQEACAQWTVAMYNQMARDPGLQYEAITGGSTYNPYGFIPPGVIELLRPYRRHHIVDF